jgi:hypothetical protein
VSDAKSCKLVGVVACLSLCASATEAAAGPRLLEDGTGDGVPTRNVTYADLIELVDVGVSPQMDFDGLAISPNGRLVAFAESQASRATNTTRIR